MKREVIAVKISKNELDQELNNKIDRLDGVISNFTNDDKAGFLAYNGEKFFIKRMNDVSLRSIFKDSDIQKYRDSLYEEKGSIKNSFRSNFNMENASIRAFKTQLISPKEEVFYTSQSRIVLSKRNGNILLFLTEKGLLIKFDLVKKETIGGVDLVSELKKNFAIQSISAYDFLALEFYKDDALISTTSNGVLFFNFAKGSLEVKLSENGVVLIRDLGNGTILCGIDRVDANVAFFNFESGMKVESSNILKRKLFQLPILVDSYKSHLFLVGRPYGANTTQNVVHYWKKDLAGHSFNNADGEIFPGFDYHNHTIKLLSLTEEYMYVSGLKENGALFIWQYDLRDLQKPFREFVFDKFKFKKLDFVDFTEDYFITGDGNFIYFLDARGNIEKNIKLSKEVKDVFIMDANNLIVMTDKELISVSLPDYISEKNVMLNIYSSEVACNNIDIFIKSNDANEKFAFIDLETSTEIAPYFLATHKNETIVKILGSTAKKIGMKILIPEGTEIEGIVVNPDRLFLK
jgi:hypothetical protein